MAISVKRLSALLVLLFCAMAVLAQDGGESTLKFPSPTWTMIDTQLQSASCNGATCALTLTLAPGDVVIADAGAASGAQPITSVTGGGGTWTVCSACHILAPLVFNLDIARAYNTAVTATGSTTITITIAASNTGWSSVVHQFRCTGCLVYGPVTLDQVPTPVLNSSCTACSGPAFTGLAGEDMIDVFFYATNNMTSWPGYTLNTTSNDNLNVFGAASGSSQVVVNGPASAFMSTGIAFRP